MHIKTGESVEYSGEGEAEDEEDEAESHSNDRQSRTLTTVGKELRVDGFEGLLTHHSRRTFGLKAPVQPLDLLLREARHAAQGRHGFWAVTRRRFELLKLRICNAEVEEEGEGGGLLLHNTFTWSSPTIDSQTNIWVLLNNYEGGIIILGSSCGGETSPGGHIIVSDTSRTARTRSFSFSVKNKRRRRNKKRRSIGRPEPDTTDSIRD